MIWSFLLRLFLLLLLRLLAYHLFTISTSSQLSQKQPALLPPGTLGSTPPPTPRQRNSNHVTPLANESAFFDSQFLLDFHFVFSHGKFVEAGEKFWFPDDVTMGYIIGTVYIHTDISELGRQ